MQMKELQLKEQDNQRKVAKDQVLLDGHQA
jgi:hypothetical protein